MRSPDAAFELRASLVREMTAALEELEAGDRGPQALHYCRVRLKRARALGELGKAVAPGLAVVFDDAANALMRQLSKARDISALADAARMLAETANHKSAAVLAQIADALEAARQQSADVDLDVLRAGIRDLSALAQVWPEPSPRQIRAGAKRMAKRARRARRRGCGAAEQRLRHVWRKREQRRLFAATVLEDAWPGRRLRRRSHALTDLLGLERDTLLLIERIAQEPSIAGGAEAAERAQRVLRKHDARLRKRADKLGARLSAAGV